MGSDVFEKSRLTLRVVVDAKRIASEEVTAAMVRRYPVTMARLRDSEARDEAKRRAAVAVSATRAKIRDGKL